MGDIPDIKTDLPMSMTMAAFFGISWFVGAEINTSLFMRFKRRRGLYFWSCAVGSWGVILQPLFIILADFGVWRHLAGSITMIYLTWLAMVVPQSWVLYSRLHLIMREEAALRWIKAALLFNSVVFSVPTIVIGILAQATNINPNLMHINTIWDRLQLIVFFVQETSLSILYIYQARKFLRDSSLLHKSYSSSSALTATPSPSAFGLGGGNHNQKDSKRSRDHHHRNGSDTTHQVLHHLIYTNLLIIALDATLLGIQCADLFYLQGAFKPCVYGVKLKVEFVILNRLIKSLRSHSYGSGNGNANAYNGNANNGSHPLPGSGSGPGPSPGLGPASPNYYAHANAGSEIGSGVRGNPATGRPNGSRFWARHSRTRSNGGRDRGGGGGGEEGGDQVWLSQLERGKGPRSASHESQSPILDIDELPPSLPGEAVERRGRYL
ncbi:hypothetical protein SLS62_010260 [Diatrype stigma]|uniref:DUF7703 domain-containing protein n=1 Tax=Diatrype stigma TaxID=117547 RepID=A0AAN9YIP6_9PEZI